MFCKNCGGEIAENATACSYCGQAVTPVTTDEQTTTAQDTYTSADTQQNIYDQSQYNTTQATTIPVTPMAVPAPRENVVTGIVGALIGAAIGGAVIILLGRLGYVASISGWILAVCTMKGYQLLGKGFSMKSAIICLILIIVTPYLADRLDWALYVKDAWGDEVTLGEAFAIVPELIGLDASLKAEYIKGLVMIYIFAALGAFSTIKSLFSK